MFGLNMYSCAARSINNHAEAVAFYESCKTKRGHDHGDERRIKGKESSKQMSVRIRKNGDVAFKYHDTDVVTWRPNNSYVVHGWASQSTATFASTFMPHNHFMSRECQRLQIGSWSDGTVYPVWRSVTVYGDTVQTNGVFARQVVDRKAARVVLARTRYAECRDWYNVTIPMMRDSMPPSWNRKRYSPSEFVSMLDDTDRWLDIMLSVGGTPDAVREMLYRNSGDEVYITVTEATLPANKAGNTWSSVPND